MILPTGGSIEWGYGSYIRSTGQCEEEFMSTTPGINKRILHPAGSPNPALDPAWIYKSKLDVDLFCAVCTKMAIRSGINYCDMAPMYAISGRPRPEARTTVTSPDGHKVEHYFNVLPFNAPITNTACNGFDPKEYGLPFTRRQAE